MPGIGGIITPGSGEAGAGILRTMIDAMVHDPSSTTGTYENPSLGLYIGWVAHAGSFADCMPVWNETRDVCLIFAGEDFTDIDEIDHLRARGHDFPRGDASYLVHLYEEHGPQFMERLNGWFSGVLIDLRQRVVILFNDRFGLHRVYCHTDATGFCFASEAKSLLRVRPRLRKLDLAALAEVFSFGCVIGGKTLFPDITLLPGAARWTFASGKCVGRDSYFDRGSWEQQTVLPTAEFYARLKATFARVIPRYLRPLDGIGMSLTGGLDGRMIMAWANVPPGSLRCYTFGGEYRECADVRIARRVAGTCRQTHKVLEVGAPFCAEFPALAEKSVYVSDGTMDVTGSVELYANGLARRIAPIRLTGNYGSEILRGNVAFRPGTPNHHLLNRDFLTLIGVAEGGYRAARQEHDVSFIAFKQVPWYHYGRLSVESSQLTARSPYLDNDLVALMYQARPECVRSRGASLQLIADGNARLATMPTDRGRVIERFPFIGRCREVFQEFTQRAEYAYDYGMPQWLATIDHGLAPLRPERLFLGRHKFYHFRIWYRDRLGHYLKDMLLDPRSLARPYLNGKALEAIVNRHIDGTRNYTSEIHQVLTAELVHRQLIEQTQCTEP